MEASLPLGSLGEPEAIAILVVCILGVAFFSSAEAAILSVSRIRVRNLAEKGHGRALALQRLVGPKQEAFLGTVLLLSSFLTIIASSIWTVLAFQVLTTRHLASTGGLLVASLMMTFLIVLFGEIAPKTLSVAQAERYSLLVAVPIEGVVAVSAPVVRTFTLLTAGIVRIFGWAFNASHLPQSPFVTDDEIRMLADVGEEEGTIEADENEMIHGVLELGDTRVREIMVPRIDIQCVSAEATLGEALDRIVRTGHSRIPVFRETSDNIVGILYAKDLLPLLVSPNPPEHLPSSYVRPAIYIPESKRVDDLLTEMRRAKNHMVIVMDEYGGTAGLVTIEDILEEIVGEIQDEYDTEEELPVQHQLDGSIVVDGKLPIDEVNELMETDLPTGEFDTIGGFVVGQLGRAPVPGEEVSYDGLRLVVEAVEARRLLRVHIFKRAEEDPGEKAS